MALDFDNDKDAGQVQFYVPIFRFKEENPMMQKLKVFPLGSVFPGTIELDAMYSARDHEESLLPYGLHYNDEVELKTNGEWKLMLLKPLANFFYDQPILIDIQNPENISQAVMFEFVNRRILSVSPMDLEARFKKIFPGHE